MKAVVFHGVGDIRLDNVIEPRLQKATDAIVRITTSAICGTDLHMVRGTMPGVRPGTILGHEGVGIVEEVGKHVRNFAPGDRVVVASTIACGYCSYCRDGYYAQCDNANPKGKGAGSSFFGGPEQTGPFNGLQAELVRVPFASVGMVKLPEEVGDDQAIFLSDILPTGYFGAKLAEIEDGDTVAVFGCGPVGQFAIAGAQLLDAGRIFAVDNEKSRLEMARRQGAETIDFDGENPVELIKDLTGGIGVDRVIDAVGVDAAKPHGKIGDAPSQVLEWGVQALAKAGTLSIIGVYPQTMSSFPIGAAMGKNLTLQLGNCNHRRYMPELLSMIRSGALDPAEILTNQEPLTFAIDAYKAFSDRRPGWIKVSLKPGEEAQQAAA